MNENIKKIVLMSLVMLVAVMAISGGTFAYFNASAGANNNVIKNSSYQLNASLNITSIRKGNLIPVKDNLIMTSLNGSYPCQDSRGYSLCSLYRVNLTNNGPAISLNGYVITNSGTTFTTDDLKYQLLTKSGNTYTSASDVNKINITTNTKNYFKLSNNNISFSSPANGSLEYYLVIWLSDDNTNQLDTVNKTFNGSFVFEALNGGSVKTDFTS